MPVTFYFSDHGLNGHRDLLNGRETFLNLHLSKQGQDRLDQVTLTPGLLL